MSDSMYECNPQRVGFNALCEIIRNLHCLLSQTQLVNELYIYWSELRYEGFCLLTGIEIRRKDQPSQFRNVFYILIDFSAFNGVLLALKNKECNDTGHILF